MTKIDKFWPKEDEIVNFCSRLAEQLSDPILLSIHQPVELLERTPDLMTELDESTIKRVSQEIVLDDFLYNKEAEKEGFCFRIITGSRGSGKSHYVKWVKAQLKRIKWPAHIVWISKSDSLRTIFEKMFEGFEKELGYEKMLQEISTAHSNIQGKKSGETLGNALRSALQEYADRCKEEGNKVNIKYQSENDNDKKRNLRREKNEWVKRQDHAEKLRFLFLELADDFQKENGVFRRIFNRALQGREKAEDEENEDFKKEDLEKILNEKQNSMELETLNKNSKDYYIELQGESGYEDAIAVLNSKEVIDQAIYEAFKLDNIISGTGTKTFQEIFTEFRQLLRKKDQELIFLVEDFVAMSGIQKQLLPFFIQDYGERTTDKKICMFRSMVAATEDVFRGEDTYLDRSKGVREISKKVLNLEEAVDRTVTMIGKYFNAMRWGAEYVRNEFDQSDEIDGEDNWVKNFQDLLELDDELKRKLDAFGYSSEGYALFPYNKNVIRSLVERHFLQGTEINYLPRRIVTQMISEPIDRFRQDFVDGKFPLKDFGVGKILTQISLLS